MATEVKRTEFRDPDGQPIILIEKSLPDPDAAGDDNEATVGRFHVRAGNRELRVFDDEDAALSLIDGLGGIEVGNAGVMAIAAEIGGTAVHQASHAGDIRRLAAMMDDVAGDEQLVADHEAKSAEKVAAGGKAPKAPKGVQAAQERIAEREGATAGLTDDSQATGVMPLTTGLGGRSEGPVVERVEGVADEAAPGTE